MKEIFLKMIENTCSAEEWNNIQKKEVAYVAKLLTMHQDKNELACDLAFALWRTYEKM